jgi:hypothetical protein
MKLVQKAYRIEDGAGYRQCMMPFSMCPKYAFDERSSRYRYDRSQAIVAGCTGVLYSRRQKVFRQRWIEDMKSEGVAEHEAVGWEAGSILVRLMGKRVVLNDESVCKYAMALSKTIERVEWGLERC